MLPACQGEQGLLPAGIHQPTLAEVRQRFVDQAPANTIGRRELIFEALELHVKLVRRMALPLWTLGDVTAQWGGSGPVINTDKLLTMGGLTDAFVVNRDSASNVELARRLFSQVLGPDRSKMTTIEKAFVEVIFP